MAYKWIVTVLLGIYFQKIVSISSLSPPQLISPSTQVILAENNPLQLSCRGQKMINWTISRYQNITNQDIRNCSVDYVGYLCKLTIPSVKITDFGNYSCFYDEIGVPQLRSKSVTIVVGGNPKAVLQRSLIQDDVYEVNKTYHLSCIAYGYPIPEITWKANISNSTVNINRIPTANKELTTIQHYKYPYWIQSNLTFIATTSVKYLCNATNDYGYHVVEADVAISDTAEALTIEIDTDQIEAGSTINIKCSANKKLYNNSITWKWKPFAQHIPLAVQPNKNTSNNETRYSFYSILTITNVTATQAGMYICEVHCKQTNKTVIKSVAVIVKGINHLSLNISGLGPSQYSVQTFKGLNDNKPYIHSVYGGNQLNKGDKINLLCIGDQRVNWTYYPAQKNPQRLSKSQISCSEKNHFHECTLELKDAVFADSGSYECSFEGAQSKFQSDTLNISITDLPEFVVPSNFVDEQLCKLGDLCNISCTAQGNPLPTIEWMNSDCLDDSCSTNYGPLSESDKATDAELGPYTIQSTLSIGSNTSGRYSCKAVNLLGKIEQEITVIASEESEMLAVRPSYQLVHMNHTIVTRCTASKYYYVERQGITWTKNGENLLVDGDKYKINFHTTSLSLVSELTIVSAQLEDSGDYFCTVIDKIKTLQVTDMASIKVIETIPPIITLTNINGSVYKVDSGKSLKLLCSADGSPNPEMIWYWNKTPLNLTSMPWIQLNKNKTELYINRAEDEHSGIYECQAVNSGGNALVVYTVTVSLMVEKSDVGLIVGAVLIAAISIAILVVAVVKKTKRSELPNYLKKYLEADRKDEDPLTPLNSYSVYKPTTEDLEN